MMGNHPGESPPLDRPPSSNIFPKPQKPSQSHRQLFPKPQKPSSLRLPWGTPENLPKTTCRWTAGGRAMWIYIRGFQFMVLWSIKIRRCLGSGRPRGPQKPSQKVGAFGPHLVGGFLGPPGPIRPQISTRFDRPKNHVSKRSVYFTRVVDGEPPGGRPVVRLASSRRSS